MTKTTKIITITLAFLIVFGGLGYLGLQQFSKSIYSQRTCEWANIDNIELHTGVNIPKIKKFDCEYQKKQNTKKACFDVDKRNVDIDSYIKENNFKKLNSTTVVSFADFLKRETNIYDLMSSSDLFYSKGSYKGEAWQTLLDSATGRLWVTIKYKD